MKRNPVTLITAVLLLVIFLFMLFSFQVRQTQVAVVTTFGEFSRSITEPGLKARLPWPVQKVYKFDNRIQTYERKFEQTITRDQINLLVSVYAGWRIIDPRKFLERFNGDIVKAEQTLEPLIRNAKTAVVGQHLFSDLVSTNVNSLKFDQIEEGILKLVKEDALNTYGIGIEFLGIKQLGLPESITATIFERMRAERQRLVARYQSEGEREAKIIRVNADSQANDILSAARAEAIRITGEADNKAATFYAEFEKSPQLAVFLFQLRALEASLKERTSLILDQQTPPFNMLSGPGGSSATKK